MLKVTSEGIEYNGNLYVMSPADVKWVLKQNKENPLAHPARNLRSCAHVIYEIEDDFDRYDDEDPMITPFDDEDEYLDFDEEY